MKQQDVGSLEGAAETRRALEHINRIYQRYILPAFGFLDPKTRFKQGIPTITAIRRTAKMAAESGHPALNEELQFSANTIQSYIKDIDALRLSLERYVRTGAFGYLEGDEDARLIANVAPRVAWPLSETPLAVEQSLTPMPGSDWQRLEARVPDDQQTLWWLMGMGANVEVIEPLQWRDGILASAREILSRAE